MLERQPLLAQVSELTDEDNHAEGRPMTRRERAAELLESSTLHKTVIALIAIDAGCVLADLCYTLLSHNCTPEGPEAPLWLELLSHVSLAITTLFLAEIPLTIWALGLRYYNPIGDMPYAPLHAFDAIIIITTFTLEAVLKGRERELAGLLIVFRLWRLVKLVGGIAVGARELGEEDAKELAETRRKLSETLAALRAIRDENETLKQRIVTLEGNDFHV